MWLCLWYVNGSPLPSNVSREYEGIYLFLSQSNNDLVVTEVIMALLFKNNVFSG